jgi:hypothetical protein
VIGTSGKSEATMKDLKHPENKLKDLSPLEVVLLAMEKVYREFLAAIDHIHGEGSA